VAVRLRSKLGESLSTVQEYATPATTTEVQPGTAPDKDILGFKVGEASTWGLVEAEKGNTYTFVYTGSDQAGNQSSWTNWQSHPRGQRGGYYLESTGRAA
jgi:hypothetical protein